MVFPGKIKRNDGPEDTAFMEGRGPADRSQLGPYPLCSYRSSRL
jgi:hypothetical protein